MWLVRVDNGFAVFGLVVDDAGVVVEAAPIARWAEGRRGREVVRYFRGRGAKVSWKEIDDEVQGQ